MTLRKTGGEYRVVMQDGPRVCYQRPSVDVLFESVAQVAKGDAIGAILTGMGSDGARRAAQDEAGRGPHDRAGRSQLRGFWNAARGHPAWARWIAVAPLDRHRRRN